MDINATDKYRNILLSLAIFMLVFGSMGVGYLIYQSTQNKNNIQEVSVEEKSKALIDKKIALPLPSLIPLQKELKLQKNAENLFYKDKIASNESEIPKNIEKIEYEIDPSLLSPKKSSWFIKRVMAQESKCADLVAPNSVSVHLLESSLTSEQASQYAVTMGVDGKAYKAPSDGTEFDYFFSNAPLGKSAEYFLMSKKSGFFTFHIPIIVPPKNEGEAGALSVAESNLPKLKKIYPSLSEYEIDASQSPKYRVLYGQKLPLKVIGSQSIDSLSLGTSFCDLPDDKQVNTVEMHIDGNTLQNVVGNSRIIKKTIEFPSQNLIEAIKDADSTSLIEPEIFGLPKRIGAKVTIKKVSLVYTDFGNSKAQCLYSPVYLVEGVAQSDTGQLNSRVVSAFSATKLSHLQNLCIETKQIPVEENISSREGSLVGASQSGKTLKYQTFKLPTPTESPIAKYDGGVGTCYGNQVDYIVTCYQNKKATGSTFQGTPICSRFVGIPITKDTLVEKDPFGVCQDACVTNILKKNYSASEDVGKLCNSKYWSDISSDLSKNPSSQTGGKPLPDLPPQVFPVGPTFPPNYEKNSGEVECSLTVCPC